VSLLSLGLELPGKKKGGGKENKTAVCCVCLLDRAGKTARIGFMPRRTDATLRERGGWPDGSTKKEAIPGEKGKRRTSPFSFM